MTASQVFDHTGYAVCLLLLIPSEARTGLYCFLFLFNDNLVFSEVTLHSGEMEILGHPEVETFLVDFVPY